MGRLRSLFIGLNGAQTLKRQIELAPDVFIFLCSKRHFQRPDSAPVAERAERDKGRLFPARAAAGQ